ncbi:MAG: hypothetical protein ACREIF_13095 [Chthoniobacterales bacterium]
MSTAWPFDQPRDCAVIVTGEMFFGDEPVLHVTHDADDHGRQFAGLTYSGPEKAKIISLAEIGQTDSSLLELSKLPVGWHAWRYAVEEPWIREPLDDSTPTI